MKFFLSAFVSAFVLCLLFNTSFAAKYENILLPKDLEHCISSMDLQYSIHTERIAEDEKLGGRGWINPFRNIDRAIARQGVSGGCVNEYKRFRDRALVLLNNAGYIQVFGDQKKLGYFLRKPEYIYGGF